MVSLATPETLTGIPMAQHLSTKRASEICFGLNGRRLLENKPKRACEIRFPLLTTPESVADGLIGVKGIERSSHLAEPNRNHSLGQGAFPLILCPAPSESEILFPNLRKQGCTSQRYRLERQLALR